MEYRKGVLAVIFNKDNKFLLVEENNKSKDLGFVQGGIEVGETAEQAIKRELKEELNLTNFEVIKKCNYQNKYDYPQHIQEKHKIKGQIQTIFLIKFLDGNHIKTNNEILSIKWMKPDEFIQKLPYDNLKTTAREALKELSEQRHV